MTDFENLTQYLQKICDYKKLDVVSVSISLFNLQNVCRDCKDKLEKIRHTITSNQIEEIYNNLADAKTKWTSNVGEAEEIWVPGDPYSGGGSMELKPGKKNELIHNVTQYLRLCLTLCLKIKKELMIIKEGGPPTYIPTPASPLRETDYPRNSPHHPSQTYKETERLVRAFCQPVEALETWVEKSGHPPVGFLGTGLLAIVKEAVELLQPAKDYLVSRRPRPTVMEVRGILQKLEEAAGHAAQVRGVHDHWNWRVKVHACGPPLKAYVHYIDPDQSESLPWRNGWKTTVENKMHEVDVQTLLYRMKQINI
jgi:hypothetical protein